MEDQDFRDPEGSDQEVSYNSDWVDINSSNDEDVVFYDAVEEFDDLISTSIDLIATALQPATAEHLSCNCTVDFSSHRIEMVIRDSLGPHNLVFFDGTAPDGNEEKDEPVARRIVKSRKYFIREIPRINPRRRLQLLEVMPKPSPLAIQMAKRVIAYARVIRNTYEHKFGCLNCGYLPHIPVTGICGHTRCVKCITDNGACPCGFSRPYNLHVNVVLQGIICKIVTDHIQCSRRIVSPSSSQMAIGEAELPSPRPTASGTLYESGASHNGPIRKRRNARIRGAFTQLSLISRIPISPRARFNYALKQLEARQYEKAMPYLALAAASEATNEVRAARLLLAQILTILNNGRDPRHVNVRLNRSIRKITSNAWIRVEDMECILCLETFTNAVTTPCGHTFCRVCLERTLDYGKRCPLCKDSFHTFNLKDTLDTEFIGAALATVDALKAPHPDEHDLIPIFSCTLAFPSIPCPLLIFDRRYWLMVRRVLETGTRRFGMVSLGNGNTRAICGTVLEVRDCVQLEDGSSILSTVGISRFTTEEILSRNGCEMARIKPLIDIHPDDLLATWNLNIKANTVFSKAVAWLKQLPPKLVLEIETTFGPFPKTEMVMDGWASADGPTWIWWLIAVLPLRHHIKLLILSTNCLAKRLLAVTRTLDALEITGQY